MGLKFEEVYYYFASLLKRKISFAHLWNCQHTACGERLCDCQECKCCGREAELNEDGECASCKADLEYSIDDYLRSKSGGSK